MRLVVDASVAIKCVLPETHSSSARSILENADALLAPDLIRAEAANTFWKRVVRNEFDTGEARAALTAFGKLPIRTHGHDRMIEFALELALRIGCTVHDGLYLSLALAHDVALVTADRPLFELIDDSPLADHVRWIADPSGDG